MEADETQLFDPGDVETVAETFGVDADDLAAVVARHQQAVEDLPGVENIVYEWRKQYEDPLVERTETAYYLHRRTVAGDCNVSAEPPDGVGYVALDRTVGQR